MSFPCYWLLVALQVRRLAGTGTGGTGSAGRKAGGTNAGGGAGGGSGGGGGGGAGGGATPASPAAPMPMPPPVPTAASVRRAQAALPTSQSLRKVLDTYGMTAEDKHGGCAGCAFSF